MGGERLPGSGGTGEEEMETDTGEPELEDVRDAINVRERGDRVERGW